MKSFLFCLATGMLFAGATLYSACAKADSPACIRGLVLYTAPLACRVPCEEYAGPWYDDAVTMGADEPIGIYETALADCEYGISVDPMLELGAQSGPDYPIDLNDFKCEQ